MSSVCPAKLTGLKGVSEKSGSTAVGGFILMHLRPVSPDRSSSLTVRVAGALLRSGTRLLVALCVAASPLSAHAQAVKTASIPPPEFSRLDLYGGYAYFHPF